MSQNEQCDYCEYEECPCDRAIPPVKPKVTTIIDGIRKAGYGRQIIPDEVLPGNFHLKVQPFEFMVFQPIRPDDEI